MTRAEWLEARRTGIGGSDIAAVLGLSPWRTPIDVWRDKVEPGPEPEPSEAMYWGTVLEDVVAREYSRRTGNAVQRLNRIIRHPLHDWAIGTVDRFVVSGNSRARVGADGWIAGAEGVLEVKTVSAFSQWGRDGDEDALPAHVEAQAQWYCAVTGLPWCDVAALIGGQRLVIVRVMRDDAIIAEMLRRAETFWRDHVLARVPPPPQSADDVVRLHPRDNGETLEADSELLAAYAEAREAKRIMGEAQERFDKAAERIKLALGERSALVYRGREIVTWRAARPTRKTDWAKVAYEAKVPQEIIQKYTSEGPGSRRFVLKDIAIEE